VPSLDDLKDALRKVAAGGEISYAEFKAVSISSDDPVIQKAAYDAWNSLRLFFNDDDIRAHDKEYEGWQREAVQGHLEEIEALERGEDPNGRRLSRFDRWAKRLGFKS
jgi:hypothetical protein